MEGVEPWEIGQPASDSYPNYKLYTDPLPAFFNGLGYKTVFLSTAPLSFLNQRNFLSGTKFSTIIGEEAFLNQPKYVFDAAPDSALYEKALALIHEKKPGKPLFLAMQTISSHKPYRAPGATNERTAFAYSDQQLKAFYDTLKKEGFFKQ